MSIMHPRRALVAIAGTMLAIGTGASAASAMTDLNGQPIANTSNPQGQVVGGPTVVQKLADPATPNDDSPSALAALGSPGDPEDDLADALDAMGAAASSGNRSAAASARSLAINILEGNPIANKAYSGMPLLNWNSPAKVKNVPAGGNVVVREVRFGEHALSDTWLLSFDDPNQPYTITFRITEVGTQFGGLLSPSPLLSQGGSPIGGENQALQSLVEPLLATGTTTSSRFVQNGQEFTRAATQDITVAMPPAGMTDAILEPNLQPTKETLFTLERTSAERLDQARADFGFSTTNPSATDKANAIGRIGDGAPEKELWGDLQRSGRKAKIGLLRATRTQVLTCFGKPTRAAKSGKQERWRYGSSLTLRFNKGRVISFILRGKKYAGVHKISAGSSVPKVRKALGKNAYDRQLKSFRAVIKVIKSSYADIRVHVKSTKSKKITRIDGKLVSRKSLNRLGRRLSVRR